jgi:DNA-binding response OmpR family regulator
MKIVILEDNLLVGDGLLHTVRHLGYEALLATNLDEAKALTAGHDDVVVAIADAGLKHGEHGSEYLEWLKAGRPTIRRILISGADQVGAANHPAVDVFLKKPFGLAELRAVLRTP